MVSVPTTRQAMADAYKTASGSASPWFSVHSADPGSTGASEAAGGGYARVQRTWSSGTGGVLTTTKFTVTLPAGTWTHCGQWSASSGGTFTDGHPIVPAITLSATTTVDITPSFLQQ